MSSEYKEIKDFIEKFRTSLSDDIFASQEFSIKLIQVPKISNTCRNDLSIEFVNWNNVSDEDKEKYETLVTIIKDRVVKTEAMNPGKYKPGKVIALVNASSAIKVNQADHKHILAIFQIRPYKEFGAISDPFETNTDYCHYDEAHNDYLYQDSWVSFLIGNLTSGRLTKEFWKQNYDSRTTLDIKQFEIYTSLREDLCKKG